MKPRRSSYPVVLAPPGTLVTGATAVVTGAAGRLGRALVGALAGGPARIWALDRRPVEDPPAGVRTLRCDLTEPEQVDASADAVLADHPPGTPCILFSVAGVMGTDERGLAAASPATWLGVYATNVVGPVQLVGRLLAAMGPGSGIVFVSSVNQDVPSPWPHYAASRAALGKVVEDLAIEFAPRGIRVNGVAPARFREAGAVGRNPHIPLYGTDVPLEALVEACLFLADAQRSPATTGITLRIDGGLALEHSRIRDWARG